MLPPLVNTQNRPLCFLGHDEISHAAQAQGCTTIGWEAYETCSRCDYTTYVEIPALGHDMKETVVTPPTAISVGQLKRTCSTCGYTEYEEIPQTQGIQGDMNGDGELSLLDVLKLLKLILDQQ